MKMKKFIASVLVAATVFGLVAETQDQAILQRVIHQQKAQIRRKSSMENLRDHIQSFLKMPLFRFLKKRDTQ